ncbi:stage II sporulation protein GA (sporulation sigma-E factor processing peptidase) [Anaerobacterium chartisolvens]|uniref:Sporulation sigma-E factor-processing peptidase n=1 Tax=Anaerobacterium chartisolvens TaxID=1297424 RepID=A0A369B2C9_9FIRM|nr:stage II sporulation protein GA (sporulation sigma-E factor processing peptidase) [Anaerobacterium chartisolvens]
MEIYVDILFLENIIMNFLILLVTAKFSKSPASSLRLLAASLIGAVYVVVLILFPGIKAYYTTTAKIVLSFLIIAVAFSPKKLSAFFKILSIFYVSTFMFAGAAFAFLYVNQSGGFVKNGIVYVFWQSKWTLLFLSIITLGIVLRVFWEVIQYRFIRDKLLVPVKIAFESKFIDMAALIDTGNSLYDPLTNTPVMVVEFKAIKEILPGDIKSIFEDAKENDLNCVTSIVSNSSWSPRFRLIPFTSLGKENGMLIGFKPDYIEVGENEEKKGVNDVIVGIYNRALSKNERYKALLNPVLAS